MQLVNFTRWVLLLPAIYVWISFTPSTLGAQIFTEATVDEVPQRISCPPLRYPRVMQHRGVEGAVVVQAVVDTTGRIERESVEVTRSTDSAFNQPAMQMIRGCIFRPGRVGGRAVRVLIQLPLLFSLIGERSPPRAEVERREPIAPTSIDLAQPFTVGTVDRPPERLSCPPPAYPRMMLHRGIEGTVVVQAVVDTNGRVERESVEVIASTDSAFNQPAIEMVCGCVFVAGRVSGHAVRVQIQLPVQFSVIRRGNRPWEVVKASERVEPTGGSTEE